VFELAHVRGLIRGGQALLADPGERLIHPSLRDPQPPGRSQGRRFLPARPPNEHRSFSAEATPAIPAAPTFCAMDGGRLAISLSWSQWGTITASGSIRTNPLRRRRSRRFRPSKTSSKIPIQIYSKPSDPVSGLLVSGEKAGGCMDSAGPSTPEVITWVTHRFAWRVLEIEVRRESVVTTRTMIALESHPSRRDPFREERAD